MIVHGKEDSKSVTEGVQRGRISVVKEYCYLGTWIDEEASYQININKIKGKVQAMINTTKQVGSKHEVGRLAIQTRMKLLEVGIP